MLAIVAITAACVPAQTLESLPHYQPRQSVAGVIRIWGHGSPKNNFMGRLVKSWEEGFRKFQPGVVFVDTLKGTASAQFANRAVTGDGYLQYGTASRDTTLGLNLQSTTAIGGGAVGQAAPSTGHAESAVLLDLNSDAGLPDTGLLARLSGGASVPLHPGRNLIPIDPYQVEHLSFDLDDGSAGGVRFQPGATTVQLYPGAVAHQQVDAMRTVTVVGRIVGSDGQPKTGIQIRNHAGQAWPENDGVFTLELSRRQPSIEVFDGDRKQCAFDLTDRLKAAGAEGAVVLGDLKCE